MDIRIDRIKDREIRLIDTVIILPIKSLYKSLRGLSKYIDMYG